MSKKDRIILTTILFLIGLSVCYDVWSDWHEGSSFSHIIGEAIIVALNGFGIVWVWTQNSNLKNEIKTTQLELAAVRVDAEKWKSENQSLINGLSDAIDKQMDVWSFTDAEKEVALLLLKGLTFKEISSIRDNSEKTIRQHALKIYEKSKLAGRAELSAFFLEDLLKF